MNKLILSQEAISDITDIMNSANEAYEFLTDVVIKHCITEKFINIENPTQIFDGTVRNIELDVVCKSHNESLGIVALKLPTNIPIENPVFQGEFEVSLGMISFDYSNIIFEELKGLKLFGKGLLIGKKVDEAIEVSILVKYKENTSSIYFTKEQVIGMFKKQMDLNNSTSGREWYKTKTAIKTGKKINWLLCVHMELKEMLDSFNWEHWKTKNDDLDNAAVELVDAWHFLMSLIMEVCFDMIYSDPASPYYPLFNNPEANAVNPETNISEIDNVLIMEAYEWFDMDFLSLFQYAVYNSIEDLKEEDAGQAICKMLTYLLLKKNVEEHEVAFTIKMFLNILAAMAKTEIKFDSKEMIKLYYGKNILNEFRQENGYAIKQYAKIWSIDNVTKEDNYFMMLVIKDMAVEDLINSPELLKNKLTELYSKTPQYVTVN